MATFVALLSHVAGGGTMPSPIGIVLPWVFSVVVCTLLAGRKLSAVRLTIAVVGSQVLFHSLFVLGTGRAAVVPLPSGHAHGHVGALMTMVEPAAMTHADASMWVWHAIAAAVTVWALHRGESALLRLRDLGLEVAAWARRRLFPVVPTSSLRPATPAASIESRGWHVSSVPHLSSVWRRGPPVLRVP